jgi:hypothetical protein
MPLLGSRAAQVYRGLACLLPARLGSLVLSAEVVPFVDNAPVRQTAVVPPVRLWPEFPTLLHTED